MPLTDTALRNARPGPKNYKLSDSGGLYALITPQGGRWWRFDYRFSGKRKTLSVGTYPEVGLRAARQRRDELREQVARGIDPGRVRKDARTQAERQAASSFEAVAREYISRMGDRWEPSHSSKVLLRLRNDVFPWLGNTPISDVRPRDLLEVLKRIEGRGAFDSARRTLNTCSQVFRYAMTTDRTTGDPCYALKGSWRPVKGKHFTATTNPQELGGLLRAFDGYEGGFIVRCALRLMPLVFVRPRELQTAEWSELDLGKRQWLIPASKMKIRTEHLVPLSRQALAILEELKPLTGAGRFLFPNARTSDRPMSNNALLAAMRRMNIDKNTTTGHGFRATARTLLDEVHRCRPDVIEHQLAHAVRDPNGRAYNRTSFLDDRVTMMQMWADYLDSLKTAPEGPVAG